MNNSEIQGNGGVNTNSGSPARKLRILQVTARYYPLMGGIETHVYEVARRMARMGHEVTVMTTDPGGKWAAQEMIDGVNVRRARAYPEKKDYYFAPDIYRWISRNEGNWDVMHVQGYHTLVPPLAITAARKAGIPFTLTFHSGGNSSALRNAIRHTQWQMLRPFLSKANLLCGVSHFEANQFRQALNLPLSMFRVIPNGSNLPKLDVQVSPNQNKIISVGRLEKYKGHQRVIDALPFVQKQYPDVQLDILGVGPYERELRERAQSLGLNNIVEIKSVKPTDRGGMAAALASAGLITLMSDYEAHPIAVMEALSLHRPVLVTHTSGLGELADRGLVQSVPLSSSPVQVADAICEQLRHPYIPKNVDLPTWDGCTNQLVSLYSEISK